MFQFIHCADIHLDSPLRGLARYDGAPVDALRGASRRALEKLVALAIEQEVKFVLVAGDLYDGDWKDYNTGLFLVKQMARLKDAGIRVFVVAGNHDAASQITRRLRLPENVRVLSNRRPESVELDDLGVVVHGQGYATRVVDQNLAQGYPDAWPGRFNIGLLHTSLNGRPGHASYAPCTVDDLRARGYDYWALGHVHQREIVSKDPWIVFPGNTQGRHVRETGSKGCTLVTVQDGAVQEVEHCELDVVRWVCCDVDTQGASSGEQVVQQVREVLAAELDQLGDQLLAVRVTLCGTTDAHAQLRADPVQWANEIRACALGLKADRFWIEKVVDRTRAPARASDDPVVDELLKAVDAAISDDARVRELSHLFDDLRRKLPSDLTSGADGLDLAKPEVLREAMADAREIILAGLLDASAASVSDNGGAR